MYFFSAKQAAADKRIYFGPIVLVLMLCLFFPAASQAAEIPPKTLKTETDQTPQIPQGLSPEEVDTYLAGLSDVQARQVLARKLKQEAAGNLASAVEGETSTEGGAPETIFHHLADGVTMAAERIGSFFFR